MPQIRRRSSRRVYVWEDCIQWHGKHESCKRRCPKMDCHRPTQRGYHHAEKGRTPHCTRSDRCSQGKSVFRFGSDTPGDEFRKIYLQGVNHPSIVYRWRIIPISWCLWYPRLPPLQGSMSLRFQGRRSSTHHVLGRVLVVSQRKKEYRVTTWLQLSKREGYPKCQGLHWCPCGISGSSGNCSFKRSSCIGRIWRGAI